MVYDFLKECGTFFVLTVNGDAPAGRPFGAVMEKNDTLYICTGRNKAVYRQFCANPRIQLVALRPGSRDWLRLTAEAQETGSREDKRDMLLACPNLTNRYSGPEDENFALFALRRAVGELHRDSGTEILCSPEPEQPPEPVPEPPALPEEDPSRRGRLDRMKFYPVTLFSEEAAEPEIAAAGCDRFPPEEDMARASRDFGGRTVFARAESDGTVSVRSFVQGEEENAGADALFSAFTALRDGEVSLAPGTYLARTRAGFLAVNLGPDTLWLESAAGPLQRMLSEEEEDELRTALGLSSERTPIRPCLAGAGGIVLLETLTEENLLAPAENTALPQPVCLYHRGADGVRFRGFGTGGAAAAGLLGWWLHLLRKCGEEVTLREGRKTLEIRFGPDGRLFVGGNTRLGEPRCAK